MKTQALDSIGALKGGTFWDFSTFLSQKLQQNWKGDLLLQKNSKKPTVAKNNWKSGPISLARYCMLREKSKTFWFSSLGQMVQFDTIKVHRTFKNYFGQFVWIPKAISESE